VDRVSSYPSGRHFIAEDVNATPTIFGPLALAITLAITFPLCGHDNDRFDPVEAPQRMGRQGFAAPAPRALSISGWTTHDSDRRYHRP
jgi:hypothetical protein